MKCFFLFVLIGRILSEIYWHQNNNICLCLPLKYVAWFVCFEMFFATTDLDVRTNQKALIKTNNPLLCKIGGKNAKSTEYKIFMMRLTTTCYNELKCVESWLGKWIQTRFRPPFQNMYNSLNANVCVCVCMIERESVWCCFFLSLQIHRNDLGECGFRITNPRISHFRQRIREFHVRNGICVNLSGLFRKGGFISTHLSEFAIVCNLIVVYLPASTTVNYL